MGGGEGKVLPSQLRGGWGTTFLGRGTTFWGVLPPGKGGTTRWGVLPSQVWRVLPFQVWGTTFPGRGRVLPSGRCTTFSGRGYYIWVGGTTYPGGYYLPGGLPSQVLPPGGGGTTFPGRGY